MTFDRCYEAYREEVYRMSLRYGGGRRAFAEDLTHDVFLKLLERVPDLKEIENVGGWLYRVTANLAISRIRQEQSIFSRLRAAAVGLTGEGEDTPEAAFEQQESAKRALTTLRSLPARERVVLCMKLLDGKSQREIAEALSMSEGYVSKLFARARQRIDTSHPEADHVPMD